MTIADRIKEAREGLGLTKAEFARALGVSRAAVTRWENGQAQALYYESLKKIAQITGKPISWIVDEELPPEMRALCSSLLKLTPAQLEAIRVLIEAQVKD